MSLTKSLLTTSRNRVGAAAAAGVDRNDVLSAQAPASVGVDPALMATYQWRSIGPDRGGRSIAVSGVLQRPKEGYFGATGGGLWKTTDGGETWTPVTDGQITQLVGRRGRRLGNESRHRLHRHGRIVHPRQHPAGRRRLQVHRRRQDLDARRLPRRAEHLQDPHPSDQPGHRVRRGVRPVRSAERRARRVQERRRRRDVAEALFRDNKTGAVDISIDRKNPERDVRRAVGGLPHWNTRCRAAARAAGSSSPRTAARRGPKSRGIPACRPA